MDEKLTFGEWKREVNKLVERECGVSIDDLPDAPYRDMYDDGLTPEEMCEVVMDDVRDSIPF